MYNGTVLESKIHATKSYFNRGNFNLSADIRNVVNNLYIVKNTIKRDSFNLKVQINISKVRKMMIIQMNKYSYIVEIWACNIEAKYKMK